MMRTRFIASLAEIDRAAWNALVPDGNPFVRHEFLANLEATGCIRRELGWAPHHATLWRGDQLVAAAPAYLKANSHGEFVFDHAWANAHERYGRAYYPKLLVAVPYSPVPGPRLLARDAPARDALVRALVEEVERLGLSSAHINFADEADDTAIDAVDAGPRPGSLDAVGPGRDPVSGAVPGPWLRRADVQFHWNNRGYADFDAFLAALTSKRRKEIRRERAAFATRDWRFDWLDGHRLTGEDVDFVYACYVRTFDDKGNYPALTHALFVALAGEMPDALRVLVASERGERVAMAWCLEGGSALYGRYWGALRPRPGLHFECCYYRGIEHCIATGLSRFEPGAQGEHKLARGFLPVATRSRHYVADAALRSAIARSLERESAWFAQYTDSLMAHSPYAQREAAS